MGRSWASTEGLPFPLGASWIEEERACNFALYSKYAETVTLLLYRDDDQDQPCVARELRYLTNKSGRVWHCRIGESELNGAVYYAYAVHGPPPAGKTEWHHFDPDKVLLDPYARAVFFPPAFDRQAAIRPGSNAGKAPLGVLPVGAETFDWGNDRSPRHESDLVIYELHVKGFTYGAASDVAEESRGTFAGIVEKIPYLKDLGVTAVELLPVQQFDPLEGNYWGYMTLNFFAPHHAYCNRALRCGQPNPFKRMVRALHEAGIEVILDVVYNHTVEGDQRGPIYSFKGIDNSTYYMMSGDPRAPYLNYSGAGNTIHSANNHVRQLILDSLRYWVKEMHVDGFRFDLASIFARNSDGSLNLDDPGFFGAIASDPELTRIRLIAEPWDAGGAYQLGHSFPSLRWRQWNGGFRDDIRRFIRGQPDIVATSMTRLYGSDDLFPESRVCAFHPWQGINYVTAHDGFSLYDLVSYDRKHNLANGHDNTDGTNESYSWNCGWEGDDGVPPEVMALRKRQAKNFCCLLMLANGTPMFRMGDEFLQTQGGNNNPYNQDNDISWLDWRRLTEHQDVYRFFKLMIGFRKAHPSLCRSRFWRNDVRWYGADKEVDTSFASRSLAFCLQGASQGDQDIYAMINAWWEPLTFTLHEGNRDQWTRVVDTYADAPHDFLTPGQETVVESRQYSVGPRSVVVLVKK
jgi:isoamylase